MRKALTLHHGSLLFDTDLEALVRALSVDDEKIISKGIQSVRQRVTNIAEHLQTKMTSLEFKEAMLGGLLKGMETYDLSQKDIENVMEIKRAQFDTWEWNFGNNPKIQQNQRKKVCGR